MSNTYINYTFESKVDWVKKINECQKEIERLNNDIKELLKENGNKEKVIKAQDNIINELEKYLEEIKDRVIMYGIDDDTYKTTNLYRDIKNKIKELQGSDKE